MVYMVVLMVYTDRSYIHFPQEIEAHDSSIAFVLLIFQIYPTGYELVQLYDAGVTDYLGDFGNWIDCVYILSSIAMTFVHASIGP